MIYMLDDKPGNPDFPLFESERKDVNVCDSHLRRHLSVAGFKCPTNGSEPN